MYNSIPLTKGASALVDDVEVEHLMAMGRWSLTKKGYAVHWTTINGRRKALYMHRVILDAPPDLQVDHINQDRLDNRRANLRFATRTQNNANRGTLRSNSSGFRGVNRNGNQWETRIRYHGQRIYLGSFSDLTQAAQTYDVAARLLFKDFATPNCPTLPIPAGMKDKVLARLARRGITLK